MAGEGDDAKPPTDQKAGDGQAEKPARTSDPQRAADNKSPADKPAAERKALPASRAPAKASRPPTKSPSKAAAPASVAPKSETANLPATQSALALAKPTAAAISGPAMAARPARLSRVARSLTADTAPMEDHEEEPDPLWTIIAGLARITAVALIALTLVVWGRAMGAIPSSLTLDWAAPQGPWLLTLLAAVFFPVSAVGLWLLARWGAVVLLASVGLAAVNVGTEVGILPHATLVVILLAALSVVLAVLVTIRTIRELKAEQEGGI